MKRSIESKRTVGVLRRVALFMAALCIGSCVPPAPPPPAPPPGDGDGAMGYPPGSAPGTICVVSSTEWCYARPPGVPGTSCPCPPLGSHPGGVGRLNPAT